MCSRITEWSITSSDRDEWIDLVGIAAQGDDGVAHRREVHYGWHAGEVLHQDPLGREGDLLGVVAGRLAVSIGRLGPARQGLDVRGAHLHAVLVAKEVLQEHLDAVGQSIDAEGSQGVGLQREIVEATVGDLECRLGGEGIE